MKRQYILTVAIAVFLIMVSFHGVSAANPLDFTSTSCGETLNDCTTEKGLGRLKDLFMWVLVFSAITLIVMIPGYFVAIAIKRMFIGESSEVLKEYRSKITSAIISFAVLAGAVGILYWLMVSLGLSPWVRKPFTPILSMELIPHAYAQTGEYLSSPIEGTDSLYDFFLLLVRAAVRWFIYPGIIAIWIYTGFSYVAAQGNPEKIIKSHKWLFIAVAATVVTFLSEAFVFAIRDTVKAITG